MGKRHGGCWGTDITPMVTGYLDENMGWFPGVSQDYPEQSHCLMEDLHHISHHARKTYPCIGWKVEGKGSCAGKVSRLAEAGNSCNVCSCSSVLSLSS